jgi:hypothetical protein
MIDRLRHVTGQAEKSEELPVDACIPTRNWIREHRHPEVFEVLSI